MLKHWRTTILGAAAIVAGLWSAHVLWVPTQTLYFNAFYVCPGPWALVLAGIGLLLSADGKNVNR